MNFTDFLVNFKAFYGISRNVTEFERIKEFYKNLRNCTEYIHEFKGMVRNLKESEGLPMSSRKSHLLW